MSTDNENGLGGSFLAGATEELRQINEVNFDEKRDQTISGFKISKSERKLFRKVIELMEDRDDKRIYTADVFVEGLRLLEQKLENNG